MGFGGSTIAAERPTAEIHQLSIGGKSDPVRLGFTAPSGPAIVASVVQMGNRFRLILNEVDVVQPDRPLAKLPVACAVWVPRPNLKIGKHRLKVYKHKHDSDVFNGIETYGFETTD